MHLAARADCIGVLEALLAAGGCPLLGDLACLSAIDVAARFNSTKALKLFSQLLDSDVQQENEPPKATLDFCEFIVCGKLFDIHVAMNSFTLTRPWLIFLEF